jgi:hypothetical protein
VAIEPASHLCVAHVDFSARIGGSDDTYSEERIYSILSIAAIGLGLVLALALAYS